MTASTFENEGMPGYFLPEESQLRLTRLGGHIRFLAQLAQPRSSAGPEEWLPDVRFADLMFCLEQLAEQLEVVLMTVSWPASRAQTAGMDEEPRASVPSTGHPQSGAYMQGDENGFAFGATLDQIDKLNSLVSTIRACADAISAGSAGTFAADTLPAMGNAIFEGANQLRELIAQLEAQPTSGTSRAHASVREVPARYGILMSIEDRNVVNAPVGSESGWCAHTSLH